jgi:hypothetical protein
MRMSLRVQGTTEEELDMLRELLRMILSIKVHMTMSSRVKGAIEVEFES